MNSCNIPLCEFNCKLFAILYIAHVNDNVNALCFHILIKKYLYYT